MTRYYMPILLLIIFFAGCVEAPEGLNNEDGAAGSYRVFKQTFYKKGKFKEYSAYTTNSDGSRFSESIRRDGKLFGETKKFEEMVDNKVKISVLDSKGKLKSQVVQKYDPENQNNIIKSSFYNEDKELLHYFTYKYDEDNNLKEKAKYNARGKLHGYLFNYDRKGNLRKDYFYQNGDLIRYSIHEYDANDNIVKRSRFDGKSGNLITYQLFNYDTHGNLTGRQIFDGKGRLVSRTESKYNRDNKRIRVKFFDRQKRSSKEVALRFYKDFKYDDDQNLSKVMTYNDRGKLIGYGTYEYDEKGNKKKQVYYDGQGDLIGFSTYDYEEE